MWKHITKKFPRNKSTKYDSQLDPFTGRSGSGGSNRSMPSAKKMSSVVFPSSVVAGIEPLLKFREVPGEEKEKLFISKVNFCCAVFDFSDPDDESAEKDLKRQILIDVSDYVSAEKSCFSELAIAASCKMFTDNLFRDFPPHQKSDSSRSENDDEEPVSYDPAWWHLQIVYEILIKFVLSPCLDTKMAKMYFDEPFVSKLLGLFESEDPRERDCLKTVLHRIYGKFMDLRPFIRKSVSNMLYTFAFETQKHNGITELLEVFGSVISGFSLPLKEEHKVFLCRTLIPLHKPKKIGAYHQELTYCLTKFLEKEPKLSSTLVSGLLRYWPVTNTQKEVLFLSELEEVVESANMVEFQNIMVPMFQQIACCISSYHYQVAERALFLWNNEHVLKLIEPNRRVILPIVMPALERNTREHWNKAVLTATQNVRNVFLEMDEELFFACQSKFKEEEKQLIAIEERRKRTWERLEFIAATTSLLDQ